MTEALPSNPAFDRWCYATKDARTGMPLLTTLVYRVCNGDTERFDEAINILQLAFEAGEKAGKI